MLKGFAKYLDDAKFVDWIANPTEEKTKYWEKFIKQNPSEKAKILLLKEYLSLFKTKDKVLTANEKQEILGLIYSKIQPNKVSRGPIYLNIFKYAAVAIIVFGIGFYLTKETVNEPNAEIESLLQVSVDSASDTKLVLSDDKEIIIEDKKSDVNYNEGSTLVINRKDTIAISKASKNDDVAMNQLIVPFGKHSKLTLSDGSIVHLNSGSRLVFPSKFTKSTREVYLGGEAFFEVESNKNSPFIVRLLKDEDLLVQAVGTKFNVNSYDRHNSVTTVLTEGEVHLRDQSKKSLFKKDEHTVMKPGQLAEWNVSSKTVVDQRKVNTDYYTAWIDGLLLFNSETLNEITSRISAYYNVEIRLADNVDGTFKLTGKLDLNESLETIMENLAITASISYEKTENNELLIFK
ncbi:DUF4974 domain-containing protein [Muricauda sp. 2012CJ35-5]|uniref:DUF4974 domain-containing protein n=1 Tax=Flagellimonas spongiicola TaxID=2942208 RepID=A0ABT0PVT8_9FLAO|nr:FecR domain-containing protein [Allomuricauda spongiicola]MCL6275470.1 DUF4974 domain-containing protein [Allomuricauda spongiicola]